jgi:AcrR family transcriptional regulator
MTSSDSKEREIILASHSLFMRFGYSKTTMEDIGEKVRLNQASLYHYFPNGKKEIFVNVVLDIFSRMRETLVEAIRDEAELEGKLVKYSEVKLDFLQRDSLLAQLTGFDHKKLPKGTSDKAQDIFSMEKEVVISIFRDAVTRQEIREVDPEKAAQIIIHLTEGIRFDRVRRTVLGGKIRSREEIFDELRLAISYLVRGMK